MTIQQLEDYGANTQDGLRRCLDSEEFYLNMVKLLAEGGGCRKLYDAMDAGDLTAAFEAAHALKGSAGNLALLPLYQPLSEMTELLRGRTQTDYAPLLARIRRAEEALLAICAE